MSLLFVIYHSILNFCNIVGLHCLFFMFNLRNWVTQIDLPLKKSMTMSDKARSVFQNIHPSLLLFLNRLQTLIIENKVNTQIFLAIIVLSPTAKLACANTSVLLLFHLDMTLINENRVQNTASLCSMKFTWPVWPL